MFVCYDTLQRTGERKKRVTIATTPVQRQRMGGGESTVDVTLFINACSHFRGREMVGRIRYVVDMTMVMVLLHLFVALSCVQRKLNFKKEKKRNNKFILFFSSSLLSRVLCVYFPRRRFSSSFDAQMSKPVQPLCVCCSGAPSAPFFCFFLVF